MSLCVEHRHVRDRAARRDPTGTGTVRQQWRSAMRSRWDRVRASMIKLVVQRDVLGLKTIADDTDRFVYVTVAQPTIEKAFIDWFIITARRRVLGPQSQNWQARFVRAAYKKGTDDAVRKVRPAIEDGRLTVDAITANLGNKEHAERIRRANERVYEELDDIIGKTATQMRTVMGEAARQGWSVQRTARALADRVDAIGKTRSEVLARTETIAIHADATLTTFREAGIEGVEIEAEFTTAGDDAVCEECDSLSGQVFSIQEAEGILPVHPNCRCSWLPLIGEP